MPASDNWAQSRKFIRQDAQYLVDQLVVLERESKDYRDTECLVLARRLLEAVETRAITAPVTKPPGEVRYLPTEEVQIRDMDGLPVGPGEGKAKIIGAAGYCPKCGYWTGSHECFESFTDPEACRHPDVLESKPPRCLRCGAVADEVGNWCGAQLGGEGGK